MHYFFSLFPAFSVARRRAAPLPLPFPLLSVTCASLLSSLLLAAAPAHASLLTGANQAQMAGWLGEGPLALNLLFEKAPGRSAADFHAAADGKGRTFTLMQAFDATGHGWLVGGYNPQSWSSIGGFNMTPNEADRTAFLFNLDTGVKFTQLPQLAGDDYGAMQTVNDAAFGPAFGAGFDLAVGSDLTTGGVSALLSYNDGAHHQNPFTSLLDGSSYANTPNVTFGAIEVYTIKAVPEPMSLLLLLTGMCALAILQRRKP